MEGQSRLRQRQRMGGSKYFGDPEAAAIVFSSRLKLTMVGLDVTTPRE